MVIVWNSATLHKGASERRWDMLCRWTCAPIDQDFYILYREPA